MMTTGCDFHTRYQQIATMDMLPQLRTLHNTTSDFVTASWTANEISVRHIQSCAPSHHTGDFKIRVKEN